MTAPADPSDSSAISGKSASAQTSADPASDVDGSAKSPSATSKSAKSSFGRDAGIGAGAAVLFLLLRLFAISKWDWVTAGSVVDTMDFGGTISIVLGTLFARPGITSAVLIVLIPVSVLVIGWPPPGHQRFGLGAMLLLATCLAVSLALVSTMREWWLPSAIVVATLVLILIRHYWLSGRANRIWVALAHGTGRLAVAAAFVLAVGVDAPWVAREHVVTDSQTIDGYVLQTQPGFLKILTAKQRNFMIIESGSVKSRTVVDYRPN